MVEFWEKETPFKIGDFFYQTGEVLEKFIQVGNFLSNSRNFGEHSSIWRTFRKLSIEMQRLEETFNQNEKFLKKTTNMDDFRWTLPKWGTFLINMEDFRKTLSNSPNRVLLEDSSLKWKNLREPSINTEDFWKNIPSKWRNFENPAICGNFRVLYKSKWVLKKKTLSKREALEELANKMEEFQGNFNQYESGLMDFVSK